MKPRGVALLVVLTVIVVVVLLTSVLLSIISTHARLTHHQVSRIQAYYAGLAGINYAYDKLRRGDDTANWPLPTANQTYTRHICKSNPCYPSGPAANVADSSLPFAVRDIAVTVSGKDVTGCDPPTGYDVPACIKAAVDYVYQP